MASSKMSGSGGGPLSQVDIDSNRLLRGGGVDGEDDSQIEQHLAFVESSGAKRAHYRRSLMVRAGMIVLPLLVVAGAIVGVSIAMTGDGDAPAPAPSGSATTTAATLIPPPANLESTCSVLMAGNGNDTSVAADADDAALLACRELCEPAECCHFPSSFSLSCLLGNEESCMTYHASCQVIEDFGSGKATPMEPAGGELPPAPTYLSDICSPASLLTIDGFGECQAECDRATCCWEGGCPELKDACAPYASCLHLGATDHIHEDVAPHLTSSCADLSTLEGRTSCRTACQTALCCFDTESGSCPHTDDDFCTQYEVCDSLESSTEVVATKEEIAEACAQDLNTFTHVSLCEVECERGACCFTEEGCSNTEIDCTGTYEPCAFLYGETAPLTDDDAAAVDDDDDTLVVVTDDDTTVMDDDGVVEPPVVDVHVMKQQVDDTCSGYKTREEAEATDCKVICDPGLCCYDGTECPHTTSFSCRPYDACEILHGLMDDEDAIKSEVDGACIGADPTEVDTNWEHPCHKICEPAECCFDEAIPCEGTIADQCKLYIACTVLFDPNKATGEEEGGGTEGSSTEDVDIVGFTKEKVVETCLGNDGACRDICSAARCCFMSDEACKPGITCSAFEECTKYFGGDAIVGEAGPTELEIVEPMAGAADERPPLEDMEFISTPHDPYGN
uniref:Uncharacterized protein n=1 Tax=Grammatophora oceanica TaxID=210454 RepID=A0A7S1UNS1_9STRA|mmetsp:Transcript_12274/g.18002  ORF Transcript_12274/g.18002 Transcript_12274/m.18002 type:complete len:677 (+) Transcript_12274:218-2248(+)